METSFHGCNFLHFSRVEVIFHGWFQRVFHGLYQVFKSKKPINDKPCVLILTAILLHNVNSWACFINVPVDKLFPWIFHPRSCGVTVSTLDFKSSVTGSNLAGTYQIFFGNKSSLFEIIFFTWMNKGSHGVMVSTLDSESSDPSSNLGGT